jgi:transposase
MAVKYLVKLTASEYARLHAVLRAGNASATTQAHARVLLKADQSESGPAWPDAHIAEALEVGLSTVHRVRQAYVEEGLEAALHRKRPTGRQYRKLDGAQEARLVALACSPPPEGRARWTLKLLADRLVALEVVGAISPECVRTTLKKTSCSRGASGSG